MDFRPNRKETIVQNEDGSVVREVIECEHDWESIPNKVSGEDIYSKIAVKDLPLLEKLEDRVCLHCGLIERNYTKKAYELMDEFEQEWGKIRGRKIRAAQIVAEKEREEQTIFMMTEEMKLKRINTATQIVAEREEQTNE